MTSGPWEIAYHKLPKTTNWERNQQRFIRAKFVKEWREEGFKLAADADLPQGLGQIGVEVLAVCPTRNVQDTTSCLPSYKALQDGLVDYGLVKDDSPDFVKWTVFHAPVYCKGVGALWLRIHDLTDAPEDHFIPGDELSLTWHGSNDAGRPE